MQPSAEREAARVNVHLGDADEPQRRRESESRSGRTLEQQVRQLVALLQAKGGVVEHASVQVTRLLNLQLVDVAAEPHELPGQLLVLQAHVRLRGGRETDGRTGDRQKVTFSTGVSVSLCFKQEDSKK